MKNPVHSTSELARRLGLSRWTVSRALNGHAGINPETAARVREEARKAGFSPSILGRGLRSGRTDLIGIVAPDLEEYFLTRKLSVLRLHIEQAGYHGLIQMTDSSPESERAALERFRTIRCTGVLTFASCLGPRDIGLQRLKEAKIPCVQIDPLLKNSGIVAGTDRLEALRLTLAHLFSLGHRQIGVFGIDSSTTYGQQRFEGIKAACTSAGLSPEKSLRWFTRENPKDDFATGRALAHDFARTSQRPTAIVTINDRMALGAIRGLQENGLDVPGDCSVIGYDNADFSEYTSPSLTTIDPGGETLMQGALEMILSPKGQSRFRAQPTLIVRQSTSAPLRRS